MLTLETMRQMWPHGNAHVPGLIEGIVSTAPVVFAKYFQNNPLAIVHALAQFSHECGAGLEMEENLNYGASGLVKTWPSRYTPELAVAYAHKPIQIANNSYNGRMGNRLESMDGWNYRGRGLSQVTGREGYEKLSTATGLDLLAHPEYLSDPAHTLECGVADFILCGCLPFAKVDDVLNVTKHLNGGTIGLAEREAWLVRWKHVLL